MTSNRQPFDAPPAVIAVAGSSSFSGVNVLLHLESQSPECRLVALDARPLLWPIANGSAHRLSRAATRQTVPMDDLPNLLALETVDTVVHVGSHYDGPDLDEFLAETQMWIKACEQVGVRRFVYLSDYRVYGVRPGKPLPISESAEPHPILEHVRVRDAEPKARIPANLVRPPGYMNITVLRTAMTVGPNGSTPAFEEFLGLAMRSKKISRIPLQFLHEHDLARAVVVAMTRQVPGVFNLAGDGSVSLEDIATMCGGTRGAMGVRVHQQASKAKPLKGDAGNPAKCPMIISTTKFKQAGDFHYRYTSEQAMRAYCHSVLYEPGESR